MPFQIQTTPEKSYKSQPISHTNDSILTLRLGPTNPTNLIQHTTKLPNRHLPTRIQPHTMPSEAIPRPRPTIPLIPRQIILARTPRIQTKRDATQLRAHTIRTHALERLTRMEPYPERIPERIAQGFGVEREMRGWTERGELGTDLLG
jgi:hypothetical protein